MLHLRPHHMPNLRSSSFTKLCFFIYLKKNFQFYETLAALVRYSHYLFVCTHLQRTFWEINRLSISCTDSTKYQFLYTLFKFSVLYVPLPLFLHFNIGPLKCKFDLNCNKRPYTLSCPTRYAGDAGIIKPMKVLSLQK